MHVYSDFDGTITQEDATDFVLNRLAAPEWEAIEEEWKAGVIGSAECMRRQIALIDADTDTLNATLDQVQIDEGFLEFAQFCDNNDIQVTIISDGVDYFIRRILSRIGLDHLPIIANHLVTHNGRYELQSPFARAHCASAAGVCKCRAIEKAAEPRIYVGDGRSDFCVSDKPEIVFAKGALAAFCGKNATPYIGYESFTDVTMYLQQLLIMNRHSIALPHRFA